MVEYSFRTAPDRRQRNRAIGEYEQREQRDHRVLQPSRPDDLNKAISLSHRVA
jgi:hypothetical protein